MPRRAGAHIGEVRGFDPRGGHSADRGIKGGNI